METLAGQLGMALESARLYRDTQRRAAQERLVGEVTARMRQTLDVNAVLDTAVDEIVRALGLEALDVLVETPILEDPPSHSDSYQGMGEGAQEDGSAVPPAPSAKRKRREKADAIAGAALQKRRGPADTSGTGKRRDGDSE